MKVHVLEDKDISLVSIKPRWQNPGTLDLSIKVNQPRDLVIGDIIRNNNKNYSVSRINDNIIDITTYIRQGQVNKN